MTTVQIDLPDELAAKAAREGLLSSQAIESMLREHLRRRAADALQGLWQRLPQDELTPETEQEIVDEVRRLRAAQRQRGTA
ncbi:MAG: hypothetical protein MK041_05065 [Aquabacterium sp.]|nr:hypothetical protein [Aquabacterium sp.]